MRRPSLLLSTLGALGLVALVVGGCKGSDDAPTNTKDSQYVGGGQTEADKIGAQRARAHAHAGG